MTADERFSVGMFWSMVPVGGSYTEAKANQDLAIRAKELYVAGEIEYGDFVLAQTYAIFSALLVLQR